MEDERGDDVHNQAAKADPEDGPAIDVRVFQEEAVVRLEADPGDDDPEGDGIEQSGEDLGAVEAEGALGGGGALGDPHGKEGEADGGGVGRHVAGIGKEREAPGDQAAHDLRDHVARDQDEGKAQAAAAEASQVVGVPGVVMVVMAVIVVPVVVMAVIAVVVPIMVVVMGASPFTCRT